MMINLAEFLNNPVWGGIKWTMALEKRLEDPIFLEAYGYKVYSQNDEDGIINEIFNRIGVETKTFVEFGVDKGIECNSHSLLLQGWTGLWIEGRKIAYEQVCRRFAPAIRQGRLKVLNQYVFVDNINNILGEYVSEELDLLSVDVDGNDWHIWKAINVVKPRVVVIEYQGKFPPEIDWKMAYNREHVWDRSDRSGASLKALEKLGIEKGYQLVGTNIVGVNAFFVRKDLARDLFPIPATAENLYNPVRSNIVGHKNGNVGLNYVGQDIEGMAGVFEYYPDWNVLASFGFWKVEVYEGYQKNIIRELYAKMFVRGIPKDAEKLYVKYSVNVPLDLLEKELIVGISVAESTRDEFVIEKTNGVLEIPLMRNSLEEEIVSLAIDTNILWIPDVLIHNRDGRLQGIAIEGISFT